jgi:hypothetical protein
MFEGLQRPEVQQRLYRYRVKEAGGPTKALQV